MAITSITRDWGVKPSIVRITSTNTLSEVAATGYVTDQAAIIYDLNKGAFQFVVGDSVLISASDGNGEFEFAGNDFSTFVAAGGGGGAVVLPTVANRIAHFIDTDGTTSSDPADISNAGDIHAGEPAIEGGFVSHPSFSNSGTFEFLADSNISGDFKTTIRNSIVVGQDQTIRVNDVGYSDGYFLMATGVTSFTDGNVIQASNVNGVFVDSNVSGESLKTLYTVIDLTVNASDLAGGNQVNIAPLNIDIYTLRDVKVNLSTGLSGGGGDRTIIVTNGNGILAQISAALAQTPINTVLGGTGLTMGASLAFNDQAGAFSGLYLTYQGGSADYTTGSIKITVAYTRL